MPTLQDEMKEALQRRAAAKEKAQLNQTSGGQEKAPAAPPVGHNSPPPPKLPVKANTIQEMKALLQKRADVKEASSERRSSKEEEKAPIPPTMKEAKTEQQQQQQERKNEGEEEVFVESKMHRKGSKVYKNRGWKKSQNDSTSTSSSSRSSSVSTVKEDDGPVSHVAVVHPSQEHLSPMNPAEMKTFIDETFDDLLQLLASVGAEVK